MSLIKFSKDVTDKAPELFGYLQQKWYSKVVNYVIDSKYRKSVALTPWLKKQVLDEPSDALAEFIVGVTRNADYDLQMLHVLRAVANRVKYTGDTDVWKMEERWQTAEETVKLGTGDCEDGAILAYVVARKLGVPAERLFVVAGSVVGGGHCWLAYKPSEYPLNFVFLDWCYWYTSKSVGARSKFEIFKQTISEYSLLSSSVFESYKVVEPSNYESIWFLFNERGSYTEVQYAKNG